MCGICGYVNQHLIPTQILHEMNDTMCHRGPDDRGVWELQSEHYAVGLAQRRLSILDLSELGHQPMVSENGKVVITYNGEIYNFLELRSSLTNLGHRFRSRCDTEVILAAYLEWGTDCFAKFNGMFAIALYDLENERLILARDRMGKKPLYYYYKENTFIFGSELKPILKHPEFAKNINYGMIGQFMCNKCIAAPDTIFMDTYKVEPGSFIVWHNGMVTVRKYWDLLQIFAHRKVEITDMAEAKKQLRELLRKSVSSRLIADVPVGTFLSGGIDSTLITAVAQEVSDRQVDSFTIGFDDKVRNEAPQAAKIAQCIGTNHHELYMTEKQIFEMIKDLPRYYDEPFSDSSQLPCMLVSQMAARDITVALSGDGGDELCCGYKMYDWSWFAQRLDFCGAIEHAMPWDSVLNKYFPPKLRALVNNRDRNYKAQLFIDVMAEEAEKLLLPNIGIGMVKYDIESRIDTKNMQERRMVLDMLTYLPDDILTKMDRASMKYSLEVRCPMLDYRIVEWFLGVPHSLKYHCFSKKYLLKELAFEYVPRQILDGPKKGFGVPLSRWLRTVLKQEILYYAQEDKLKGQGIFAAGQIHELIRKQEKSDNTVYSALLWAFYIFQSWYQVYVEDLWN